MAPQELDISLIISDIFSSKNQNPFVGLRSYEANEGDLFFGRDKQIKDLLLKLDSFRFLSVVGSSGCGKSSLIKAGMIPKLKAGFLAKDRDHWLIAVMRPGPNPLHSFLNGIINSLSSIPDDIDKPDLTFPETNLQEVGTADFIDKIKSAFAGNRFNLLILVDQFEEIFTYKPDNEEQKNQNAFFVNLILSLTAEPDLPVYTIITMRSDYIGHCNRFYGLPELMNETQYLVPKLKWHQIREVIEYPIKLYGQQINPGLLDQLSNDSEKELDQLPVLQHCMMQTYENWKNDGKKGAIDFRHYLQTGGLKHAIREHAEQVYAELNNTQEKIIKYLFQLISDFNTDFEPTRRPQKLSTIVNVCQVIEGADKQVVINLINQFQRKDCAFLIASGNTTKLTDDSVIDISHESLLRQWDRLEKWMVEEQNSARKFKWLSDNVINNREGLRGIDLKSALSWRNSQTPNKSWANRYAANFDEVVEYIDNSVGKEKRIKRNTKIIGVIVATLLLGIIFLTAIFYRLASTRNDLFNSNSNLTNAISNLEKINNVSDTLKVKSAYNSVVTNYNNSETFYKKLTTLNYLDPVEKFSYLDAWQKTNITIIEVLATKPNMNESWEYNLFIYKDLIARCKINVEIGKRKYELTPNPANKTDLSGRYGDLAFRQLFEKDFKGSIQSSLTGLKLDEENDWIYSVLAIAYLLDHQFDKATKIYIKYEGENFSNGQHSFRSVFRNDLQNLETKNIINKQDTALLAEIEKIRNLLN